MSLDQRHLAVNAPPKNLASSQPPVTSLIPKWSSYLKRRGRRGGDVHHLRLRLAMLYETQHRGGGRKLSKAFLWRSSNSQLYTDYEIRSTWWFLSAYSYLSVCVLHVTIRGPCHNHLHRDLYLLSPERPTGHVYLFLHSPSSTFFSFHCRHVFFFS